MIAWILTGIAGILLLLLFRAMYIGMIMDPKRRVRISKCDGRYHIEMLGKFVPRWFRAKVWSLNSGELDIYPEVTESTGLSFDEFQYAYNRVLRYHEWVDSVYIKKGECKDKEVMWTYKHGEPTDLKID